MRKDMSSETKREAGHGFGLVAALILAGASWVSPVWADFSAVSIDALVNADLRAWTSGEYYPVAPTSVTVGGVNFDLAPFGANSLGIFYSLETQVNSITADVFGATTVYTLMNSAYGAYGQNIATLEFYGSDGAFASFDLIEGSNIRDHFNGMYCNAIAAGTPTANYGPGDCVRLDRQTFTLPSSFADEILTQIVFKSYGNDWAGQPFLAAVTVETRPVPLPGAALLGMLGLTVAGWRLKNQRTS
jgi:hypothetical protein